MSTPNIGQREGPGGVYQPNEAPVSGAIPLTDLEGSRIQDLAVKSEQPKKISQRALNPGNPNLSGPDKLKALNASPQDTLVLVKSWILSEAAIQMAKLQDSFSQLFSLQSKIRLNSKDAEIDLRQGILELYKASGAAAKANKDLQAQEHIVQAVTAITQAGVSAFQAMQTTRNFGAAKEEYNKNVEGMEAQIKEAKTGVVVKEGEPPDLSKVNPQKAQLLQEKLDRYSAEKDLEISRIAQRKDILTQTQADVFKQAINGFSNAVIASIKTQEGIVEENQKIVEGFIQVVSKFQESQSKSADDSTAEKTRLLEFLQRFMEAAIKANLQQR